MHHYREHNLDGLIGPTHNFAGLARGNLASEQNKFSVSNPKAAALQGLAKMRLVFSLGIPQMILPPHERPTFSELRLLGYHGTDKEILEKLRSKPEEFYQYTSASSMWTANAATVTSSLDSADKRVHITPANLLSQSHRALEARFNYHLFERIFGGKHFTVHPPLEAHGMRFDEGAANHMRVTCGHGKRGANVFVYGKGEGLEHLPQKYSARQSRAACEEIVKSHHIHPKSVIYVQQNPEVIDQGVFHNDVIAVSNESVLLFHEHAFVNREGFLSRLGGVYQKVSGNKPVLNFLEIRDAELTVEEAVKSYFFNSQLITLPNGKMVVLAPGECKEHLKSHALFEKLKSEPNPVSAVHYVDLSESMRNGGGPACLRLRFVLNDKEEQDVVAGIKASHELLARLESLIQNNYRERLELKDLFDYSLIQESRRCLDEMTQIFGLGSIYEFQKA